MKPSHPIAIVGRGCVLPGALNPTEFWRAVASGTDLVSRVDSDRWGLSAESALVGADGDTTDKAWTDRGGYVRGFEEAFDRTGFQVAPEELEGLDPVFLWPLYAARQALADLPSDGGAPIERARAGAVFGNLGFPSAGFAAYAQSHWLPESPAGDPRNRFMASGPAEFLGRAFGLGLGAYCVDAACASSLYAIKLACDRLARGEADLMLAGAVQGADDLFLHVGFTALQALSKSGQTRPFHAKADGLIPAEGAGFVALKRLEDARAAGDTIYGVIRGVGLSNDGRGKGLLAPSSAGQEAAIRAAYDAAGVDPSDVSLLECHATGTPVGDATELRSSAAVFDGQRNLPIGSLKSNTGHLITAAGIAGLIKVLEAMRHGQRPPSLHCDDPNPALAGTPFRVLRELEEWPSSGPRVAGVSAFGFGGNNAHLVVSEESPQIVAPTRSSDEVSPVVVVGLGRTAIAGEDSVRVSLRGIKFPPNDLKQALPQQLAPLEAARDALQDVDIDPSRSGAFVGIEPDPAVARYGTRWRLADLDGTRSWSAEHLRAAKNAVVPALTPASVVGTMPNIPANRLSSQLDLRGPAFVLSEGIGSARRALSLGVHALRSGELDAAMIGAVDFGDNAIHRAALATVGADEAPADGCVVLVLKRHEDALAAGDPILAFAEDLGDCSPLGVFTGTVPLELPKSRRIATYRGADRAQVLARLSEGREGGEGEACLAIVADEGFESRREMARVALEAESKTPPGVHFRERPVEGELAFVFGGAGAAYEGMGVEFARQFPHVRTALAERSPSMAARLARPYEVGNVVETLWAASALAQAHHLVLASTAGIRAEAVIGYSSGESNSLIATGAWKDTDALIRESEDSGLFETEIAGEFRALPASWTPWSTWAAFVPVDELEAQAADFEHVRITIINSDQSAVFAGNAAQCDTLVARLGEQRCQRIEYDLAAHTPELLAVREAWDGLHTRETATPRERVYSNGFGRAYEPSRETCAEAIRKQAEATLDFRPTVRSAFADGVRIFVELGPQGGCATAIRDVLSDEDIVAVSADSATSGIHDALAALVAAGVDVDLDQVTGETRLAARPAEGPSISIPMHRPAVDLTSFFAASALTSVPMNPHPTAPTQLAPTPVAGAERMQPAPALPSAHSAGPEVRHVASPVTTPNPAPAVQTSASAGLATAAVPRTATDAYLDEIAAMHQAHAVQQSLMQQQFLGVQTEAIALLLQAAGGTPILHQSLPAVTPVPSPVVAATPPTAVAQPPLPVAVDPVVPTPSVAAAEVEPAAVPVPVEVLPGLKLSREQLEIHAGGRISEIYGPIFAEQDDFERQVRMPLGRLLLADRVVGLDAEPGTMGRGTIWTETDVDWSSWYLNHDRMPAGILIESGQADLMLISYLGVDLLNRSERVYRLLGCELTYHGDLPAAGDTLRYDIHLDGHAAHGDVRLMFFHYDCVNGDRPQLSVRGGQAGFFTDEELADSAGCLWTPEEQEIVADPQLDAPLVDAIPSSLSREQVRAFADGDLAGCFGDAYGFGRAHVRSPRIQTGDMLLIEEITELDAKGGPWGRGYLRGELPLSANRWFYDGHFKNDPCMPGTLMFEGCLQAMSIYVAAMGYTLARDGWRFQPKPELPFQLSCRGQATPTSERLTYELFVEELVEGPSPTLYADLLCTIDGLKAFHARRVAIELVPDWPLEAQPDLLEGIVDPVPVAEVDGFKFGYASMLACAWGKPSDAFGPMYAPFDGPRKVARLPGPPYHFMTRVTALDGPIGVMKPGAKVTIEYDIPDEVWYFDENGCPSMPFAVLLEAALQPCGWLASYVGSALTVDGELGFRNLDGNGTLLRELLPSDGTLVTDVEMTSVSATGGMIIQGFTVTCRVGNEPVYELETVFGFFPPEALKNQAGLPVSDAQRAWIDRPSDFQVDLTNQPAPYWSAGRPQLADPMLLMLDRVTGYWPDAGEAGLGQMRGEKDVDQAEWFFKAHFFQDPVQPGSLGIEAMIQLLQFYMLEQGMDDGIEHPRFEPLALDEAMSWRYRGQVLLHNACIESTIEITREGRDDRGAYAIADASLWVDGKRIYEAFNVGMRIVSDPESAKRPQSSDDGGVLVDPAAEPWLADHCPTYTRPALPFMSVVDLLADGAGTETVVGLDDVRVFEWLVADQKLQMNREREGDQVRLVAAEDGRVLASGRLRTGPFSSAPAPLDAITDGAEINPYETGALFHGPLFQLASNLRRSASGASFEVSAENEVRSHRVNPGVLDAATHGIPHDALAQWFSDIDEEVVAYPALIKRIDFFGPTPTEGALRCEVRPAGVFGTPDLPVFDIQLIGDAGVWATIRLVESCFPKGPLGAADGVARRSFLADRTFEAGVRLSANDESGTTCLSQQEVHASDWFPGTIETVYGTSDAGEICRRERAAAAHAIHPRRVFEALPTTRFDESVEEVDGLFRASGAPGGTLDISKVRSFWSSWFDVGRWPVEDLYYGLIERFTDRVVLDDPDDFASLSGKSVLYLANHETAVESLIFSIVVSGLTEVPTVTLAKAEHRETWLGKLIQHCFTYPGVRDPRVMTFFDRDDKESLRAIIGELALEMAEGGRSVMVHVEGTRAFEAGHRVEKMTGAFIDMALKIGVPIVPVRFTGGLPSEPLDTRAEFPVGMGRQSIWLGRALRPEDLAGLHYGARKEAVISGINGLGGGEVFAPSGADPAFEGHVNAWTEKASVSEEHAVLREVLTEVAEPCGEVAELLAAKGVGDLEKGDASPWLVELGRRLLGS